MPHGDIDDAPARWIRPGQRVAALFLLVVGCIAPTFAQTTWIGRPTIGDVMRHELADLLEAQQQATQNKAEFNARIARARQAFLATSAAPAKRAAPESEFARLLYEKDLYYLIMFVGEGFSEDNRKRMAGIEMLTGGRLDNGIRSDAQQAFESWVRGVRTTLGAPRDGQMAVAAMSGGHVVQAVNANEALYLAYKDLRDRQEINGGVSQADQQGLANVAAANAARMPDGGVRLHQQETRSVALVDMAGAIDGTPLGSWVRAAGRNGQEILDCTYGPSLDGKGKTGYATYPFWYRSPPADIERARRADAQGALRFLGDKGITTCPTSDMAALALRRDFMANHPVTGNHPQPVVPLPQQAREAATTQPSDAAAAEARRRARIHVRSQPRERD